MISCRRLPNGSCGPGFSSSLSGPLVKSPGGLLSSTANRHCSIHGFNLWMKPALSGCLKLLYDSLH